MLRGACQRRKMHEQGLKYVEQQGPGSAFRLPTLNDAMILAFFDALRLSLNSGVGVTVTILGRTLTLTGGVEQLKLRHPEFDWTETSLIESMDLPLECGISVHFTRGENGVDEIRTLPEDAEVPAIVLHYLRKEIHKMTGKPAKPATSPMPASETDVRSDRIARLKRLHMTVVAEPEAQLESPKSEPVLDRTPEPVMAVASRRMHSSFTPPAQPSLVSGLMTRLGLAKTPDTATRRMQNNITFALDTSAAKASDSWFKALISAEMIMVVVFTIGIVTIIVS